jgi:peptidoglycan/LPS O-acetylase OafA/YrhL
MARKDQMDRTDFSLETGGLESAAGTPADDGRFAGLDGVRAVAALAVVLTHVGFQSGEAVSGPLRSVLARLDVGVAVFFVLSGFLLHRPQALAALGGLPLPATVPYLWRRALRVLPGYWLAVVAALVLLPANDGAGLGTWLRSLTLTQVYVPDGLAPGLTQMWSLATEVTFYLALPLLGRLAGRTLRSQLLLCGTMYAVGLLWQGLVAHDALPPHAGYWLPGHADWFALGMAMAVLSAAGSERLEVLSRDSATCWLGAAALLVVAGTPLTGPYGLALLTPSQTLSRTVLYGGVAVLLLAPAAARRPRGVVPWALSSPVGQFLGRVSYGVFSLHLVVLAITFDLLDLAFFSGSMPLLLAVVVPVSVLLGWASLRAVEEPALRLRRRGPGAARG